MLFKVILPLKTFTAHLTTEGQFGTFVRPLVNHQIVRFREPPLTVFTNEFALGTHFSPKLSTVHFVVNLHYSEHLA